MDPHCRRNAKNLSQKLPHFQTNQIKVPFLSNIDGTTIWILKSAKNLGRLRNKTYCSRHIVGTGTNGRKSQRSCREGRRLDNRRTDNYVKNHFYSTLRRSLRRINKYLGFKNSTNQMRSIRPSILSYLLDLSENDPECRSKKH